MKEKALNKKITFEYDRHMDDNGKVMFEKLIGSKVSWKYYHFYLFDVGMSELYKRRIKKRSKKRKK